jgi:hypothetical protein
MIKTRKMKLSVSLPKGNQIESLADLPDKTPV